MRSPAVLLVYLPSQDQGLTWAEASTLKLSRLLLLLMPLKRCKLLRTTLRDAVAMRKMRKTMTMRRTRTQTMPLQILHRS
jgi:hypothetical protein